MARDRWLVHVSATTTAARTRSTTKAHGSYGKKPRAGKTTAVVATGTATATATPAAASHCAPRVEAHARAATMTKSPATGLDRAGRAPAAAAAAGQPRRRA